MQAKLLDIDLSARTSHVVTYHEDTLKTYFAGSGLAVKIIMDGPAPFDPLDPRSPIVFMAGLLAGTPAPAAARTSVCARSPLTGIWGESSVGGFWARELRFSGLQGLVITGRAEEPTYLWVHDGEVEFRSAESAWGKTTYETAEGLNAETDPKAQVACIGPAGEMRVPIASVMFGGIESRAAGRTGMGAVMGSKNLKAIVVRGAARPDVVDRKSLLQDVRKFNRYIREVKSGLRLLGTAGNVIRVETTGDLPIKNWLEGSWPEGASKTTGQTYMEKYGLGNKACFGCAIGCANRMKMAEGPYGPVAGHGPEYETTAGFGALCLNENVESIIKANDICNRYGLDTISTSAIIAFAIECFENGLITEADTDGVGLTWGNDQAIVSMVEKIAKQEGFGKVLGRGVRAAAEEIGRGAEQFAIHTKGLEYPYHDPRTEHDMAVSYATSTRGACHMNAFSYPLAWGLKVGDLGLAGDYDPRDAEGKAKVTKDFQEWMAAFDALGLCKFIMSPECGPIRMAKWLEYVTGWKYSLEEFMTVGERLFNLKRLYSVRLGITRKDDVLPERLVTHARPSGEAKDSLPDMARMMEEYYELRGWNEDGVPLPETLARLGLEEYTR